MFGLVPFDKKRNQMQNREPNLFDIDSVFENFFNDSVFPSFYNRSGLMKVDIREEDASYIMEAELPGIKKDQVNLSIDDEMLTIEVQYDEQNEEDNKTYLRRERRSGSMTRSFNLANVDSEKIDAQMEDGILTLKLPKKEPEKKTQKKIDIK